MGVLKAGLVAVLPINAYPCRACKHGSGVSSPPSKVHTFDI
jgi:hypothetical protein